MKLTTVAPILYSTKNNVLIFVKSQIIKHFRKGKHDYFISKAKYIAYFLYIAFILFVKICKKSRSFVNQKKFFHFHDLYE